MERKKRQEEGARGKSQGTREGEGKKGKRIVLMHFKTFIPPSSNRASRLMNERAVRARTNPNANIIIIRRESGRSLTLDNAYCYAPVYQGLYGGYAPVRRFT